MPKILCIGHITLDTFLTVENVDVHCDLNHIDCKISFGFGAKVPVKDVFYSIGGGAANTAVGLRKLGHEVSVFTILGTDAKAKDVIKQLSHEKIDISHIEQDSNPTDQASIISYEIERTIFTYSYPRKYSVKNIDEKFTAIYLSSVGTEVAQLYKEIIHLKQKGSIKSLFYNPGSREVKNARSEMNELLKHVDYLIVNVEEGCEILNLGLKRTDIEMQDLMNLLNEKGPKHIVLTDSDNGAYVWSEGDLHHLPAKKVEVVEKTGAGDAYASGYIAAILYGYDIKQSSKFGILNSSNAIQSIGAQTGLLTKADLIRELGEIPNKN